jgi:hypothetical protein
VLHAVLQHSASVVHDAPLARQASHACDVQWVVQQSASLVQAPPSATQQARAGAMGFGYGARHSRPGQHAFAAKYGTSAAQTAPMPVQQVPSLWHVSPV